MFTLTLLVVLTLLVLLTAFVSARAGKEWLYASIVANLFFVSMFGAKLVEVGGFVSNVGNVFYAGVFFATYLLIEHYGMAAARSSIWLGLYAIGLFLVFSPLVMALTGAPSSLVADLPLGLLSGIVPGIAVASIFGYLIAQNLNIWLYGRLRGGGASLWATAATAVVVAQGVDSILFFYIAFAGILPTSLLWESLWAGYAVKVAIGVLGIPLLYGSWVLWDLNLREQFFPQQKLKASSSGLGEEA